MAFDSSQPTTPVQEADGRAEASFAADIAPQIGILHARRKILRERAKKEIFIIAAISFVSALILAIIANNDGALWLVGPILGLIAIAWRLNNQQKAWQAHVTSTIMPVLCKALRDVSYQNDKIETSFVAPFEQLGLVPASARQDLSHLLRGRHRATGFELLYADLWQRRGGRGSRNSSSASVFHGLLFRIEVPATIPIHVVVKPRPYGVPAAFGRLFEAPTIARLTEVDLGTGEFATKFEVRAAMRGATDADGVRALISPQLQRAFLDLNEREGALIGNRAAFSAAFLEDSFYLALSRYGQSSIAGIAFERPRPFLDAGLYLLGDEGELETRLLRVLDDAHIAYRIIDRLHQTE